MEVWDKNGGLKLPGRVLLMELGNGRSWFQTYEQKNPGSGLERLELNGSGGTSRPCYDMSRIITEFLQQCLVYGVEMSRKD